jgi:syndecan 1
VPACGLQLDATSQSQGYQTVAATPPQLSTADLVAAAVGLTCGKLFALLSNGHIHVWELHLKRPPSFQV